MRITYHPDVDALYIRLMEGEHQVRTVRLTDEIALDFAEGEQLVGIEVLDAKRVLSHGNHLPKVVVDNLPVAAA